MRMNDMDKYTKELLDLLKNKYTEVCGERKFQCTSEMRNYYLDNLNDNLFRPMDETAFDAYGKGSGSEVDSGKMKALRSSSALTYNLFWNQMAELTNPGNSGLEAGTYKVEFEKQFRTLKKSVGGNPANLDAFLVCGKTNEAIACEMKMMEWIFNKPGELKAKYLDEKNYIDEETGKVFVYAAKELIRTEDYEDTEAKKALYSPITSRYDAFQMFKHAVTCYTAIVLEEPRKIEKLTLVNCAWTLSNPALLSEKSRERYLREERIELEEFEIFKTAMEPVKALFKAKGVDFDIKFFRFGEFLSLFEKTEEEIEYLKRYTFE